VEETVPDQQALTSLRSRSQSYLGYLLWVLFVLMLLWAVNLCAQLAEHWVGFLRGARILAGITVPTHSLDYWIIGGTAIPIALFLVVAAIAYFAYRAAWNRRVSAVWGEHHNSNLTEMRPRGVAHRFTYLDRLAASPGWRACALLREGDSRESYCELSASMLKHVEVDIAARAITTGFIVGMNRNPLLDTLTIIASAFELQLHVLTRLGKRPSLHTWIELLKRAGASVFLNTYVGREDALYLNLTIRKAALGLEMASDTVQ